MIIKNKITSLFMSALFAVSLLPVQGLAIELDWDIVNNPSEITEMLDADETSQYYQEAIIDTKKDILTVDGENENVNSFFGEEVDKSAIFKSPQKTEDILEDTAYDTKITGKNTISIISPYQTKRIIVFTDKLSSDWGATNVIQYKQYNEYILSYASEEATKLAYEKLLREYGEENCILDELITADQSLFSSRSWGASYMGIDDIFKDKYASNSKKTVAIIDSGAETSSSIFNGRPLDSNSYDFVEATSTLTDGLGHGTHVAGIITDLTPSNVSVMALRVFDNNGNSTWLRLNNALQHAINNKADVINMSLGVHASNASSLTSLDKMLQAANSANIPIICAAGNTANDNVENTYPANSQYTVAISAINNKGEFAKTFTGSTDGSCYGDKIDFCAPGDTIISAKANGENVSMSGTSMAAPHVSAAYAYLKMMYPSVSVSQLYAYAKQYAIDLGDKGKDPYFGWGYIKFRDIATTNAKDIADCSITLSGTSFTYDGAAKKPGITVRDGNSLLAVNTDYTVSYSNNTNAGTGTVVIAGTGDYTGSVTKQFTISKANQSLTASLASSNITVGGTTSIKASGIGTISYKSANTSVATIDSSGMINGVSSGSTTITVTATGNSNYNFASKNLSITVSKVEPRDINDATVSLSTNVFTYTGKECKPDATVSIGSSKLTAETDYTITYSNNINAGTATVSIVGKGSYTGKKNVTFTIKKAAQGFSASASKTSLYVGDTASIVTTGIGSITYNSSNSKIASVSNSGIITGTSIGSATITVTASGNSNYEGASKTIQVNIVNKKNISGCNITLSQNKFTYTGSSQKSVVTITQGNTKLIENQDYKITFNNTINAGTANIDIIGIGSYTGSAKKTYTITKASQTITATLSKSNIKVGEQSTITAKGIGTLSYSSNNSTVASVSSSGIVTGKSAGITQITVTAAGGNNYSSANKSLSITVIKSDPQVQKKISSCNIELGTTTYTYDGSEKRPSVTVKDGNKILTSEKDYKVTYSGSIKNAGTGFVTIQGLGAYAGTVSKSYTIKKAPQSITGSIGKYKLYIGETTTLKCNTNSKKQIKYKSANSSIASVDSKGRIFAKGAGYVDITASVDGDSNYAEANKIFRVTVEKKNISAISIKLNTSNYIFDGKAKKPGVTVKDGSKILKNNTDYTVSYKNNLNAGKATASITGKGKYNDSATKNFTIRKADQKLEIKLKKSTIKIGEQINIIVKGYKNTLKFKTSDKKVAEIKNGNVKGKREGKATITVVAKGNKNYNEASKKISVKIKK